MTNDEQSNDEVFLLRTSSLVIRSFSPLISYLNLYFL